MEYKDGTEAVRGRYMNSEIGLNNMQDKSLQLKKMESEKFKPVQSQKFESPKENKQLSSHRFKCSCAPSSEPYACASAHRWLQMSNGGRRFEI